MIMVLTVTPDEIGNIKVKNSKGKVFDVHKSRIKNLKELTPEAADRAIEEDNTIDIEENAIVRFHNAMQNTTYIGRFTGQVHYRNKSKSRPLVQIEYHSDRGMLQYWARIEDIKVISENEIENPNESYRFKKMDRLIAKRNKVERK